LGSQHIPTQTSHKPQGQEGKKDKGKQRAAVTDLKEEDTTAKLVALITRMASRLDDIEERLGEIPNRS
jgi:hypothetical protein